MKFVYLRNLLALAMGLTLAAGCAAPVGRLQITAMSHESFKRNPEAHGHMAIVPIWFTTSACRYSGLNGSELKQIAGAAGQKTASLLAMTITNRGYQVVGDVRALTCEDDLAAFDAETRQLLDEVRMEFWSLNQIIRATAGTGLSTPPFRCKMKAPLLELQKKLGVTQAEALVLVDSTVFVETPAGRWKRVLWNWTGAPLVSAAVRTKALGEGKTGDGDAGRPAALNSPASIEHTIAIVDPATQDVLLWTTVLTPGANARESVDLRVTIYDLLSALPLLEPKTKGQ
jgi:hypothetical protein